MDTSKWNSYFRLVRRFVVHRIFFHIVIPITVIAAATFYCTDAVKSLNYFPINMVRITGADHLDKREVKEILEPLVSKDFFAVDVEHIRDRLRQMPWVSDISVSKKWPAEVDITITEKTAAARWNKQSLLSMDGDLFAPKESSYPEGLVNFAGPEGEQITMLKYFINFNRILRPLHAKISNLELTTYLTWNLQLDNGMVLKAGHGDILTRLNHFVKVYPKIIGERAEDVEYVDLRYPNGMAVKWKNAG
ncbi:MAG TPA: cell division protein FtsQ/DivIB [Gammaproteobacteria bacterium]|jgi:cell division protein FtsQ|nr:cell division protein FtsQ/DivIB [Gammaproteobacteria bacterium]